MVRKRSEPVLEQPYLDDLRGILVFRSFAEAEICIGRLEDLRRRYVVAEDRVGVALCRRIALTGRRRCEMISRNPQVAPMNRRRKSEIAVWFRVWLETPELFGDWLSLRRNTQEYRELSESGPIDDDRR
jgi:hypothetical protein